MKIFCAGARSFGTQIDRIEAGFTLLGHEIMQYIDCADLVYSNNLWSDQLIEDKLAGRICGKYIQTVLDLAPHLGSAFPLERAREQLRHADAVTTISTFVQNDLRQRLGMESTVIYQPIKPVTPRDITKPRQYPYRFMFCGRVNDPAKRCGLGAAALQILGVSPTQVITVGSEPPHYGGIYWGVATDEMLSELYRTVDFVMFTSASEGLGLPMVEAMAAGAIPVVCRDLTTLEEFLPLASYPEYHAVEPTPASVAAFIARFLNNEEAMLKMKTRLRAHFERSWAHRMSGRGVAEAILRVYETL